jgi:hypothetical protein
VFLPPRITVAARHDSPALFDCPGGSSPSTSLARNHFRRRSRHPNVSLEAENGESEQTVGSTLPASDPTPNEQALAAERAAAIRAAVGKLPEDLREAIVLSQQSLLHDRAACRFLPA